MKRLLNLMLASVLACAAWAAGNDTYTVIVSCDGLRWDYAECFDMPFFDRLAKEGVKAVMQPSFPTKTFPNHYTLATGLYPDHHGIIANTFRILDEDKKYRIGSEVAGQGKYYGGDPIWLTAKRQGVNTATVYWVGSDVKINGEYPTYWQDYRKKPLLKPEERVDKVIELLNQPVDKRPHLVMCYFEEPDHSGHSYGPINKKTRRVAESLDDLLWKLWARLKAIPEIGDKINLIITGDHGMAWLSDVRVVRSDHYIKKEWVQHFDGDSPALIYVSKPEYADSIVNALQGVDHIRAWKKGELPGYLHYGTNKNMGDVVVLPDLGWVFRDNTKVNGGTHGWDPTYSDMLVGFRAIGPDFKVGYVRPGTFRNVCIYPLLAHLLGITPAACDGDLKEVSDMLKVAPPQF